MTAFETAEVIEAYQQRCEDRIAVLHELDRCIIAVADGAGGSGFGSEAADTVIREVRAAAKDTTTADRWADMLRQIDFRIGAGESTAIVVDVQDQGICGASVGDSQAWLVDGGEIKILTEHQQRKPLLGTGEANPVGFALPFSAGVLVVATEGFFNYARRADVVATVVQSDFVTLPRKLLSLVRLKSGELWDDVAIVVCRKRPPQRTRKRFVLDEVGGE